VDLQVRTWKNGPFKASIQLSLVFPAQQAEILNKGLASLSSSLERRGFRPQVESIESWNEQGSINSPDLDILTSKKSRQLVLGVADARSDLTETVPGWTVRFGSSNHQVEARFGLTCSF
jgi:hypothetical protein